MSTMNPAAAIMQQNKQAELGRREDRAQSQQNMLATLMTLFMQGKMSREQLDAQMKIAGERIAADRDINAATLQTHKDINSANITSNEKMAGRQIQMQEDDMKFRRTVAELSLKSNFADKLAAIAQSGRDVTTAMGASSISQLYRDQADWEGKQEVAMQATKGAATKEEYAQNLIKNMQTSQQDMKMILANTLAARGVGTDVAKKIADGAPVTDASSLIPLLQGSGALGKTSAPEMSQAILLAGQLVNAEPGKVPAEAAKKLHALLRGEDGKPGLGPQATHSLVQTLKQSAEDLRAAGGSQVTGVVDEVFGTGPLPTKGKIETVGKGLTRFQHQADLMDHLADTLTAHDPEGGNLMVRAAAKNETYKRLTTNPTPGTVINREALHAVLGETLAQGDPTKAVEVAQALAASGVGSPDVGYWQNLLFKDMGAWAQKKESTDFMASSNDAANTATRTVLSGQEDKFQDYLLLNQWNTLDDQLKQAQATFSSFPSAEMEKMVNLYQGQVNKLAGQLKARNLNPGDSITMDSASKLKLNATQAAADARLKMEQAQQESFMKDAATKYQGQVMLPRGNGPADPALQQNIPAPGQSPTAGQPYDPTQPPPPVEMPRPAPIPTQQPQSVAPVSWTPKPGMWQNVRGG